MIRAYDDNGNIVDLVEWEQQIRAEVINNLQKLDYCTECEKNGEDDDCYYCRADDAQQWYLEQLKEQK